MLLTLFETYDILQTTWQFGFACIFDTHIHSLGKERTHSKTDIDHCVRTCGQAYKFQQRNQSWRFGENLNETNTILSEQTVRKHLPESESNF